MTDRVWLVWSDDPAPGGNERLLGVYATEEAANAYVESRGVVGRSLLSVEETEVES